MILCRRPLVLWIDVAGFAAVGGLLTGLVMAVLTPLGESRGQLPRLQDELSTTNHERRAFGQRNDELVGALTQRHEAIQRELAQPLTEIGRFLEQISSECQRHGIALKQLEPLQGETGEGARAWRVHVRATGSFPAFVMLLNEMETWSPYLHLASLEIAGPRDPALRECELSWTLRLNLPDVAASSGGKAGEK